MPIYEYECKLCGHKLEIVQKMNDQALTECPNCHKDGLQKLVSAAGFQLKGTGWYATDFKNKGKSESKDSQDNKDSKSDTGSNSNTTDTAAK